LFALERYPTVWQMTSTVSARSNATLRDLFRALYPAASITGAPKRRTMEIIRELETDPRGIYTGTIGFVRPDGRCQFNVAIRTAAIDKATSEVEYGVGGGIVWDSEAEDEYGECFAKARIVTGGRREFELLETIAWHPDGGFRHLDEHLERLQRAADYFCWPMEPGTARAVLEAAATAYGEPMRVRLLADRAGRARVEASKLNPLPEPYRVALSPRTQGLQSEFVYHKTTHRSIYDKALDAARSVHPEVHDVLLVNADGELTESTIANVAVEIGGEMLTPAIDCGLLPGIERQALIGSNVLKEARIPASRLAEADGVWLLNSVRGVWPAALVLSEQGGSPGA
ncbi:MAG: aminodeoxychorismate synthase, component I, partial [Pseudomonadales bacterium]|nr:aminodeoxychorismate synthase, component I [Pseudomonadales bacterium]NIX07158.1 aminodeoxychorismate synthase, component I [Pseudomonadales bacterium]